MQDYEKLGAFYLGKSYDLEHGRTGSEVLLYDAKDLTTHAVCVGMTGSGKTGLCVSLLEEAAIDGIPAIVIDPKGDLGNLLLTFPDLQPTDFAPWVDEGEATRNGMTRDQFAAHIAKLWRKGLSDWGQDGERIAMLKSAVDVAIYTPGSQAGLSLSVIRSFAAPPPEMRNDSDAMRERITSAVSGLLSLLGIDCDPLQSREHIFLASLVESAWREGRDLEIANLIRSIQSPPFDKIGVMDLETVFPAKDRVALSMRLNNLLASPGFSGWMEGEPLNVQRLLYTEEGKPRLSILSIAHLSDPERMFFVTILLNEILAWTRSQSGTTSLRALLYMDEVFGYFPPTANPPSKIPMLTLLKQARAFGLGIVLATQNPVDLDYKGLSNTGTWFLGRLQTERDKARVLDGLEGASVMSGSQFNRAQMERTLAGLGSRVFLMNNVHDDEPVVFHTRWALSYLRGPITRSQIQTLMADRRQSQQASDDGRRPDLAEREIDGPIPTPPAVPSNDRPVVPPDAQECFFAATTALPEGSRLVYRPAIYGTGRVHYTKATCDVDVWKLLELLAPAWQGIPNDVWENADVLSGDTPELHRDPDPSASFSALPTALIQTKKYADWTKDLTNRLYRNHPLVLWKCSELKLYSKPDESLADFRIRLRQAIRERRDLEVEKLRKRYTPKLARIQDQIQRAKDRVEREESQYSQQKWQTMISLGTSVLGALLGRKVKSRTNVTRAGSTMRSAGRAARERDDIGRAKDSVEKIREKLTELEEEFAKETDAVKEKRTLKQLETEEYPIRPRKSDITVEQVVLAWTPWQVDAQGIAEPLF